MKKSFIPYTLRGQARKMQSEANYRLSILKECLTRHNEGYQELFEYVQKGADFRIKQAEDECLKWCIAHQALPYMREQLLEDARANINPEIIEYAQELKPLLNISIENGKGQTVTIDFYKDINPQTWEVTPEWVQRQEKNLERELEDWQFEDYKEFKKVLKNLYDFSARGYSLRDLFEFCEVNEQCPEPELEWVSLFYRPDDDMRKKFFSGRTDE
ncbi:MAG: hypothetical protein PUC90_02990 [Prevotella sp.]|nr:hypothetical protein [Prevotella sp.]